MKKGDCMKKRGLHSDRRSSKGVGDVGGIASVAMSLARTRPPIHTAAMNQLTRILAVEWARDGIRVNAVAPWYINTELAQQVCMAPTYRPCLLHVRIAASLLTLHGTCRCCKTQSTWREWWLAPPCSVLGIHQKLPVRSHRCMGAYAYPLYAMRIHCMPCRAGGVSCKPRCKLHHGTDDTRGRWLFCHGVLLKSGSINNLPLFPSISHCSSLVVHVVTGICTRVLLPTPLCTTHPRVNAAIGQTLAGSPEAQPCAAAAAAPPPHIEGGCTPAPTPPAPSLLPGTQPSCLSAAAQPPGKPRQPAPYHPAARQPTRGRCAA